MITVGTKVTVEKGCAARAITKGATARVMGVQKMGADYSHGVRVDLFFLNTFLSGKTVSLYARHENRLSDPIVNLNDGRPEHTVKVKVAS